MSVRASAMSSRGGRRRRFRPAARRKLGRRALAAQRKANRKIATVGMVKKILHRNAENKFIGYTTSLAHNNLITTGDAHGLLMPLVNGTTDNTRIGNRIFPRGLLVTMTIYINPGATTPAHTVILPRILVLKSKAINYQPNLTGVNFQKLLDFGNGEHSFDGYLADYRCPINTDNFTVIKDIKTSLSLGTYEQNGQQCKTFKFWVPVPKVLEYNDGDQFPQNYAPFICFGYAIGDGTVPTDAYLGVTYDWTSTLYYEDA